MCLDGVPDRQPVTKLRVGCAHVEHREHIRIAHMARSRTCNNILSIWLQSCVILAGFSGRVLLLRERTLNTVVFVF